MRRSRSQMEVPSLEKEGWPRHQVNGPVPLKGADGVVRSSTNNNRLLEPTTPSAPAKEASRHFLTGRSHPSFTKEGTTPISLTLRLFRPPHEATVQLRNQIPTWIAFHGMHG